jgi:Transposase DDE domain
LPKVSFDPASSILDSFPMPACRFGRAYRCRRLAGLAALGRDEGAKQAFYGLRAHLRICWPGVIADGHLAPANPHDLAMADDLLAGAHGWALGDRSCWSPARAELLADQGVWLLAPSRSARRPGPRLPHRLTQARRRIETVIGQLAGRYHAKRVWARDGWHRWSRWQRKLPATPWPSTPASRPASARYGSPTSSPNNPHTGLATCP